MLGGMPVVLHQIISYYQYDLPQLNDEIAAETNEREEIDKNILKKTSDELVKLNNFVANERRSREESE